MKRVYIPTTLAVWQRLVADGSMFQVSGTAFVVTPGESDAEQHNAHAPAHQRHAAFRATKGNFGLARAWPWAFTAGERGSCVVSAKGAPWSQLRASGRQYAASLVDANVNQIGDTRQVEGRGRGAST